MRQILHPRWLGACVALPAILFLASVVRAESPSALSVNDEFFDGVPMARDTQVLMISVDPKVLPHGDDDAVFKRYAAPEGPAESGVCSLASGSTSQFKLDCGVTMLGRERSPPRTVSFFLLKARKGDWYQIVASPQSGAAAWIKDPQLAGIGMSGHPILEWLQSRDSYRAAKETGERDRAIAVRAEPKDAAKSLTQCDSYEEGEGLIPATDKAVKGDWVHVACLEEGCAAESDPQAACLRVPNLQRAACGEGWARWRSADGHVTLYPHSAIPQGCSS